MKASGSYANLVKGVSEQIPEQRRQGQVTEQINMIPDPVTGLTRRHGSRFQAEADLTFDATHVDDMLADTATWRSFQYSNSGHDFVILVRQGARPSGSPLPLLVCYDRTTQAFVPYRRNVTDTFLDTVEAGGVSAMTNIGRYVFMAGNTTTMTGTSTELWNTTTNKQAAVLWVRGGAYNRKFSVTVTKLDNTQVSFSYTTPTANYPQTLDISKVAVYTPDAAGGTDTDSENLYIDPTGLATLQWGDWAPTALTVKQGTFTMANVYPSTPTTSTSYSYNAGDKTLTFAASNIGATNITATYTHTKVVSNPSYANIVAQLTSDYNAALSAWIVSSALATTPNAIAASLQAAAIAAGLTTAGLVNSTVTFDNVQAFTVDDGGDGELLRAVAQTISAVADVSLVHRVGKVVAVRARDSADVYYLTAKAQDPAVTSGYTNVTWVEGAGKMHHISGGLLYGAFDPSTTTFCVASSASLMNALATFDKPAPAFLDSTCGDDNSSPVPYFIDKKVTYLGVFQDRLLVGAGAVLRCSATGDYLNFFRSSVLSTPASDPIEMLSQGSEDDTLRYSIIYDRDLVVFGDKRQYAISGRSVLSPTNAVMPVMSQHANAADAPPLAVGSNIFYGQLGEVNSSVHQIEPGQVADQPDETLVSSQIANYLSGSVIELSNNAKPTHLFVRTTGARNSVFVFTYLDQGQQGRLQDAWHRWNYDPRLGPIIGMAQTPTGLLIFRLPTGLKYDASGNSTWVVADLQPMTTGLSLYPYVDSLRPYADVVGSHGSVYPTSQGPWVTAFGTASVYQYVGAALADAVGLVADYPSATDPYVGMQYDSSFIPTNPFVKDKNGNAITTGRLTVTSLRASLKDSSGYYTITSANGITETNTYNGRVMGDAENVVGQEAVTDSLVSIPVGRETRKYTAQIGARKWFPFTITSLEWVGQFFNRTQRF
jgi:hypothetical protein